jgi:hypothetical protein
MPVLPMTASGGNQRPAILLDEPYRFANFHRLSPVAVSFERSNVDGKYGKAAFQAAAE